MPLALRCSSEPEVSIIVPASSTPALLRDCLQSLCTFLPETIAYETIVILNNCDAASEAEYLAMAQGVHFVRSELNIGIAGAGNLGRGLAKGTYIVILHDDAAIQAGWLEALHHTVRQDPRVGAVGCKVLFPNGTLQDAGCILWRDATTSHPWVGAPPSPSDFATERFVDYCGTSALLIPVSVWDQIGGMDERFYPAYYVDVDICMAIRRLGLRIVYQPLARIYHHRGASTSATFKPFVGSRNRKLFQRKWGAALMQQEPKETKDLKAAVERAEALHYAPLRAEPTDCEPTPAPLRYADDERPRAVAAQLIQLQSEYVRYLEDHLALEQRTPRALAPYALGRTLRFDETSDGIRYGVTTGFYQLEPWGTWIKDGAARVILPMVFGESPEARSPRALELNIRVFHFLWGDRALSPLRIAVSGVNLLDTVESGSPEKTYKLLVPLQSADAPCIVIDICGGNAQRPCDLKFNDDTRILSIGLISLSLDEAEQPARP